MREWVVLPSGLSCRVGCVAEWVDRVGCVAEWVVLPELLLGPLGASVGQQLESGDTQ